MLKAALSAVIAVITPGICSAEAQTTHTYEYDVYGRLVRSERSTGTSSRVRYTYDATDNRTKVKKGISAPSATNDSEFFEGGGGISYVLANDFDGDLPYDTLTVTSISGPNVGYASIIGGGTAISLGGPDGSYQITYTMKDADNQTSSATVYWTIFTITCGPYECW